jgi:hypothetical protein
MKLPIIALASVMVLLLTVAGCSEPAPEPDLTVKQLNQLYPGKLQDVDYMEIRSGSTGELKAYTDQSKIQQWLDKVGELELTPDSNQEGRSGFLYGVSLFENKELKLGFITNNINGVYYNHNEELTAAIEQLFKG